MCIIHITTLIPQQRQYTIIPILDTGLFNLPQLGFVSFSFVQHHPEGEEVVLIPCLTPIPLRDLVFNGAIREAAMDTREEEMVLLNGLSVTGVDEGGDPYVGEDEDTDVGVGIVHKFDVVVRDVVGMCRG